MRLNWNFLSLAMFVALALAAAGCGGVNASKTVSPLDFFMPGLIKADLPAAPTPVSTATNEFATVQ